MVETDGVASTGRKTVAQNPTKLRFNVPDVVAAADALRRKGVDVRVAKHSWGITAGFADPDGNLWALRSDDGFGQ
ncbi:MAG: VOC family protein [Pseudomonadota bacterium]